MGQERIYDSRTPWPHEHETKIFSGHPDNKHVTRISRPNSRGIQYDLNSQGGRRERESPLERSSCEEFFHWLENFMFFKVSRVPEPANSVIHCKGHIKTRNPQDLQMHYAL